MRLIDADALKEEIEFHPTSVSVCMTVEQARGETKFKLRCLEDIDNAPTVDAIPVEWMRTLQEKEGVGSAGWVAIEVIIQLWDREQKEQEAQDGNM